MAARELVSSIDALLAFIDDHPEIPETEFEIREKLIKLDVAVYVGAFSLKFPLPEAKDHPEPIRAQFFGKTNIPTDTDVDSGGLLLLKSESWMLDMTSLRALALSKLKKIPPKYPVNQDVRDLCFQLHQCADKIASGQMTAIGVAREFVGETEDQEKIANNILRQAQRFPHLWKSHDN